MDKYTVYLSTRFSKRFTIEAASSEEAEALLRQAAQDSSQVWDPNAINDVVTDRIAGEGAWGPDETSDDDQYEVMS